MRRVLVGLILFVGICTHHGPTEFHRLVNRCEVYGGEAIYYPDSEQWVCEDAREGF